MDLKKLFGNNVKFYRKQMGLSQQQFAEQCSVVPNYVSEIENGKKFPSSDLIEKISSVLQVSPYVLFMDSKDFSESIQNQPLFRRKQNEEFAETIQQSIRELLKTYGFIS